MREHRHVPGFCFLPHQEQEPRRDLDHVLESPPCTRGCRVERGDSLMCWDEVPLGTIWAEVGSRTFYSRLARRLLTAGCSVAGVPLSFCDGRLDRRRPRPALRGQDGGAALCPFVPRSTHRVEQLAGRDDLDPSVAEVLVLRPDRNAELPCESECRPIVWVPRRDPVLRLDAAVLILGGRFSTRSASPAARRTATRDRAPASRRAEGTCRAISTATASHGETPGSVSRREHEPGSAADQRGQDDVRVSDDDGWQRNRRAPLAQ